MFRLLMALMLCRTPSEIDAMSEKDMADFRWLYAVCPFGPLRGDMQAWLAGTQAREKQRGFKLEQAMGLFRFQAPKRKRRRPKERKPKVTPIDAKIRAWAASQGAIEERPNG